MRAPGTVVHITSSSSVILSQDGIRTASVATRLVCDVASRVVGETNDGGLLTAALASRWRFCADYCSNHMLKHCVCAFLRLVLNALRLELPLPVVLDGAAAFLHALFACRSAIIISVMFQDYQCAKNGC